MYFIVQSNYRFKYKVLNFKGDELLNKTCIFQLFLRDPATVKAKNKNDIQKNFVHSANASMN